MGAEEGSSGALRSASGTRRLVIVADNSLLVEAIRIGFHKSGEFTIVGHADPRRTSAATIVAAAPDVILLDDMECANTALDLLRAIRDHDGTAAVIMLTMHMGSEWLDRLFAAGATATISKATHPGALATLVRETLDGHIVHPPMAHSAPGSASAAAAAADQLPLTDREREILQLVASGSTNGDVARQLWVTEQTVKFHLRNIYRKLDVANRTQASHLAFMNGLVGAPAPDALRELTIAS